MKSLFFAAVFTVLAILLFEKIHPVVKEPITQAVELKDVNFLLKEDGYSIYFRLNGGQLALVHPTKKVQCGKSCGKE